MDPKAQLEPANARIAIENLMFSYAEAIDGEILMGSANSSAVRKFWRQMVKSRAADVKA